VQVLIVAVLRPIPVIYSKAETDFGIGYWLDDCRFVSEYRMHTPGAKARLSPFSYEAQG
jgi:hypothetical protein